jgi:hypothetical protein
MFNIQIIFHFKNALELELFSDVLSACVMFHEHDYTNALLAFLASMLDIVS